MTTNILAFSQLPSLSEADECVSLASVLSQRDARLTNVQLWSVCLAACRALCSLQNSTQMFHALCISPDTLAFDANGSVCFLDLPIEPQMMYVPPEYDILGNSYKAHLYSLGMTMLYAAEYNEPPSNDDDDNHVLLGNDLDAMVKAMTADEYDDRCSLQEVVELCERHLVGESADTICHRLAACSVIRDSLEDNFADFWDSNNGRSVLGLHLPDSCVTPPPILGVDNRGKLGAITPPAPFRLHDTTIDDSSIVLQMAPLEQLESEWTMREKEQIPLGAHATRIGCNDGGHASAINDMGAAGAQAECSVDREATVQSKSGSTATACNTMERSKEDTLPACDKNSSGAQSIQEILEKLGSSLLENEVWALCRECMLALQRRTDELPTYIAVDTVLLEKDGRVSFGCISEDQQLDWLYLAPELQQCGVVTAKTCIFGVAAMLWTAADYSYPQDEAPELSTEFENLISAMTRENCEMRLDVSEVLQVWDHYQHQHKPALSSRKICQMFANDAHRAGIFGKNNLLVKDMLDNEQRHETLRHRAQLLESIRKTKLRLKPVAERKLAELHIEKCQHDCLMEEIRCPGRKLKKTAEPVIASVHMIFHEQPDLMNSLGHVTEKCRSTVKDNHSVSNDRKSAFRPVASSSSISDEKPTSKSRLPAAYTCHSTHFSPIVLPGRREMPRVPEPLTAAEKQERVTRKLNELRANLARSRLPTRLVRDLESDSASSPVSARFKSEVKVPGVQPCLTQTLEKKQSPVAMETPVAAETMVVAETPVVEMPPVTTQVACQVATPQPLQVQLQQDPRTGLFQIIPMAVAPSSVTTPPTQGSPFVFNSTMNQQNLQPQQPELMQQLLQLLQQQQQLQQQQAELPQLLQLLQQMQQQQSSQLSQQMSPLALQIASLVQQLSLLTQRSSPETQKLPPVTQNLTSVTPGTQQSSPLMQQVLPTSQNLSPGSSPMTQLSTSKSQELSSEVDETALSSEEKTNTSAVSKVLELSGVRKDRFGSEKKSRICTSTRRLNYSHSPEGVSTDTSLKKDTTDDCVLRSNHDIKLKRVHSGSNIDHQMVSSSSDIASGTYKTSLRLDGGLSRSQPNLDTQPTVYDIDLDEKGDNKTTSPPPSPSWSKDSGVSGVQQSKTSADASLMERLLNSEAIRHQHKLAAIVKLLRDEFAFDGYMENGIEDLAMAEYIYSLGNLKWDTFSNAIAEKYCDLYWQDSLIRALYEAVNGKPVAPSIPPRCKQTAYHSHISIDNESKHSPVAASTPTPSGDDSIRLSVLRPNHSDSAFRPIRNDKNDSLPLSSSLSYPRRNSLGHIAPSASQTLNKPRSVAFKMNEETDKMFFDDEPSPLLLRRQKSQSTHYLNSTGGGDEQRRKLSHDSQSGSSVASGQSGRLLSAKSESYLETIAAARHLSDPTSDASAELLPTGGASSGVSRHFDRGSVVYYYAEMGRGVHKDIRQFAQQMDSRTKASIEAKMVEVDQQMMMEYRNRKKTQNFYRRLNEATKSNKVSTEQKAMLSNVTRQLSESSDLLRFLDDAKKHLEMLHAEQWGLQHDLLQSLALCPAQNPMLLSPCELDLVQLECWANSRAAHAGTHAVHAGMPVGLLAYLFAQHALSDGFIHQFFYCFRYFISPADLLQFIIDKYSAATQSLSPEAETPAKVKARALDLLQVWLEGYYGVDFKHSQEMWRVLLAFIKNTVVPLDPSADVILDLMEDCREGSHVDLYYEQFNTPSADELLTNQEPQPVKKWESFKAALRLNTKPKVQKVARPKLTVTKQKDAPQGSSTVQLSPYEDCYPGVMANTKSAESFSLSDYTSKILAEQLTIMEQELFMQSHPVSYLNSKAQGVNVSLANPIIHNTPGNRQSVTWEGSELSNLFVSAVCTNEVIQGMIEHAQHITYWVIAEILNCSAVKVQVGILTKFIFTAKACHEMRNFATCISILDALENIIVRQLPAWRSLPSKCKTVMDELSAVRIFLKSDALCLSDGEKSSHPTIPSILIFLLHVQQLEIGGFSLANGMIKWSKMKRLTTVIDQVRRFRQQTYRLTSDTNVRRSLESRMNILSTCDMHALAVQHDTNMQRIGSGGGMQGALRRWRSRFS